MIRATVGDLLDGELAHIDTEDHHIYIIRDGETVFYVGKSREPISRLWSHLGEGRGYISNLGRLIKANLPGAHHWQIELLTPADCGRSGMVIKGMTKEEWEKAGYAICFWGEDAIRDRIFYSDFDIERAEQRLIRRHKPCLNVTYNLNPTPLPKRYENPREKAEANLEVTVSDFIPF